MSNFVEGTSNYNNSYGSIDALDNWNLTRGFFETDMISHNPNIGRLSSNYGRGLGDIDNFGDFLAGSGTGIALVIGAFVILMSMGSGSKRKRAALKAAKAHHKASVKKIKEESGVLGWKLY